MRTRNFSQLLADWQGGIRPRPGSTYKIKDVPEERIVEYYGYVPSAVSSDEGSILFRKSRPGYCDVTIYWGK